MNAFAKALERQIAAGNLNAARMLSRFSWGEPPPPITEEAIQAEIARMRAWVPPPPLHECTLIPDMTAGVVRAACR